MYKNIYKSSIGNLLLIANKTHLIEVKFINDFDDIKEFNDSSKILDQAKQELDLYFAGELQKFQTPLLITGTKFEKKVYKTLLKIPYGFVKTYQNIAKEINNPKAYRAVGNANSKNKLPIFIPCHRVIGRSNKLGGYSAGIEIKKYLLKLEGNYIFKDNVK